jgi:DNA modification methylase
MEQIGDCTLYRGAAEEILPTLPEGSIEIAFTSPPYNLREGMEDKGGFRVGHRGSKWAGSTLRSGYGRHTDDMPWPAYVAWQQTILGELWRIVTGAIYYNHKPRIVKGALRTPLDIVHLPVRQIIIWNRGSGFNYMAGAYVPRHEWIVLCAKKGWVLRDKAASGCGDVWTIPPVMDKGHPNSFPMQLPRNALETSGALSVIDPFMGVGTTGLAAIALGRLFVGIDLEAQHFDTACKRIEAAYDQGNLFAGARTHRRHEASVPFRDIERAKERYVAPIRS